MESITELMISLSDDVVVRDNIITPETNQAAADILAAAPGLYNIQMGDT